MSVDSLKRGLDSLCAHRMLRGREYWELQVWGSDGLYAATSDHGRVEKIDSIVEEGRQMSMTEFGVACGRY